MLLWYSVGINYERQIINPAPIFRLNTKIGYRAGFGLYGLLFGPEDNFSSVNFTVNPIIGKNGKAKFEIELGTSLNNSGFVLPEFGVALRLGELIDENLLLRIGLGFPEGVHLSAGVRF